MRLDLGSAYQRMGAHEKAISATKRCIKKPAEERAGAQDRSVTAIGACASPSKAIAAYQRVMKLAPEDPRPYFLLGAAYEEAGHDAKAEQIFQDAQQFRRYLGEAWIEPRRAWRSAAGICPRPTGISRARW